MTTPDNTQTPALATPIDQARQLITRLSRSEPIKQQSTSEPAEDFADDRTLVLASVGIAIAYELSRIAYAIEGGRYA